MHARHGDNLDLPASGRPTLPRADKSGVESYFEVQARFNRASEDEWVPYSSHRAHVTKLVLGQLSKGDHLAIFGAGNCNDIDLHPLVRRAKKIALVDIDSEASYRGLRRQHLAPTPELEVVVSDLSDSEAPASLGGEFDLVVSSAILTQIFAAILWRGRVTEGSYNDLVLQAREAHVRRIVHCLRPKTGVGIIVTDVVSTQTCGKLWHTRTEREYDLVELLHECLESGDFFTGTNPFGIAQSIERMGGRNIALAPPWLWQQGDDLRLVCAVRFGRPADN